MNSLQVGFSRVDITPPLGARLSGYYKVRRAEGILEPLEASCAVFSCNDVCVAILSVDNLGITKVNLDPVRERVSQETGLPLAAIFIHCVHIHTGPFVDFQSDDPLDAEYATLFTRRMIDAVKLAMADLQPARLGYGIGTAANIAFSRRFRMKDGSVRTNPGINNPEILHPIGDIDERVSVIRVDRSEDSLVLVNFANHPDSVGGCKISADWPGFMRRTVELAIPGTKCMFINGAEGDVAHVNVHPKGGDQNDMFMDFDDVVRGYGHARHMGRVVAGSVLQVYDKVKYIDVDRVQYLQEDILIPYNLPKPENMPEAHKINDLHNAGRDDQIPYTGMMLTTVVAEAARMVRLEHAPEAFWLPIIGFAIGKIAFLGIPGEPFTGVGLALKESEDWELVVPACNTNGKEGYFPMMEAYNEGGYEARSSNFKAGVAERIIEGGKQVLGQLKK